VIGRTCLVFAIVGVALAQNPSPQPPPPQNPPPKKDEPAPLFDGKLGTRSSQKNKESATLGFNGIDPSGKLGQKMLDTPATPATEAKVKKMAEQAPPPAELEAFIKEGGLNKR
jgi:hypothetical protein